MKNIIPAFALAIVLTAGTAFAADTQVSNLSDFGLNGIDVVSDVDGMEVRGMAKKKVNSYAATSGYSQSNAGKGNKGWQAHEAGISKKNKGGSTSYGASISISGRAKWGKNGNLKRANVAGTVGSTYATAY